MNADPSPLDFPCVECGARVGTSCLRFASTLEDPGRRVPVDPHDARKLALVRFLSQPCEFHVVQDKPGDERVRLEIGGQLWNEFTGPVAKGVIALLRGR